MAVTDGAAKNKNFENYFDQNEHPENMTDPIYDKTN